MSSAHREWRFYIDDMLGFAEKACAYTSGLTHAQFLADSLVYDATLRNLELIGEAATHVRVEMREQCPDVPWRLIIATRNRLIHAYLGVDNDTIWSIIQTDLPEFMDALRQIG